MFKVQNRIKFSILATGDLGMILLALLFSQATYFRDFNQMKSFHYPPVSMAFSYLLSFYIFDLYEKYQRFKSIDFISRFVMAAFFGFSMTAMCSYLLPVFMIPRSLGVISLFYILVLVSLWRFLFDGFFTVGFTPKKVVIVGAGHSGKYIGGILKDVPDFEIVGYIDDNAAKQGEVIHGIQVIGGQDILKSMAKDRRIDVAVVAITHEKSAALWNTLFFLKTHYIQIMDVAHLYEALMGKIPVSHLHMGWIVFSSFSALSRSWYLQGKRYLDIFLSVIGFIISSPLILLIALAVKIESRGPIIYKQFRIGEGGKEFLMYKFRSMFLGSENVDAHLYTSINDPRITKVGRLIRKARLDELPQLWNVLIGNMSIVGPRPEAVDLSRKYEQCIPYYSLRHVVKPGLTGWAQVRYYYSCSPETALEKFKYDMFYLKNMSFLLDIQIIL